MRAPLIAFSLALLLPLAASAQALSDLGTSFGNTASFTVSVAPQYPAPQSSATLSFLSGSLDLTNAMLAVSVGGKALYQGSVRPVAVPLGKAGSITTIVATMTIGSMQYTQSLSIQPQEVTLIAEPIASVPPLYPGKPSVPLEGKVRVVAVANLRNESGASINPTMLSYEWTVDGARIANSSGIGKSALMVASPLQYRARDVSVTVTGSNGSLVGGTSISLSSREPSLRIYENDPLLGIRFERALSGEYAIPSEATLFGAPFSLPLSGGALSLRWLLNGAVAQTGSSITLRPTGKGQGAATLSFTASAGSFTSATLDLPLSFGAKPSSNFFGL